MDQHAANEYVRRWAHQPVPMRPSPLGLAHYRTHLGACPRPRVLVFGGTPELADLALEVGAERVVRIDLSPEILAGMRLLATRDWSAVETVAGDWLAPRPEWAGAFDMAMCDGGPLFLDFPGQWRLFLARAAEALRPGGRLVVKLQAHLPGFPAYETLRARLLADFLAACPRWSAAEREAACWRLAGNLWQACYLGHVAADGAIDKRAVGRRMDEAALWLAECLPDPALRDIAHQELREMLRNADRTPVLERLVPHGLALPLFAEAGFQVQDCAFLADSEPVADYCYQVAAVRT